MIDIWTRLSRHDIARLKNSAKEAQKIETKWDRIVEKIFDEHATKVAAAIIDGKPKPKFDITKSLIEHSFRVQIEAMEIAKSEDELDRKIHKTKLAQPKIPSALDQLRRLYDKWKRGEYQPKRPRDLGKKIEKAYLDRINQAWTELSEDFRTGKEFTQEETKTKIKEKAVVGESRAKTIVRTETTRNYNQGRKKLYDQSDDITHYLFMAVRDHATTKWCKTRHGVVFEKETKLLEKNVPPVHWNCRSEILPLSPYNPSHKKLINDPNLKASNRKLEPLPNGWIS